MIPVPANPLVKAIGLAGDVAVGTGLLLVVPLARMLTGWIMPSPFTRLAADRSARLLAGAVVPLVLAVAALTQQVGSLQLGQADAPPATPLTNVALLARLLAAAAFASCLPALVRGTDLRAGEDLPVLAAGELSETSGRDLALFRIADGLQLVAVLVFFAAAFILPLLTTAAPNVQHAAWILTPLLAAAGIGAWEALRAAPSFKRDEQPPLSWWFGFPLLLALFALVAASFAARGF
jgi:formate hydrogenlyase subunit 4